ncbi:B12-binding domain-containing radical SAM protein [Geobacter pickeringii]|uniref:Radical SAM protein n=1 Tax=Geobacter pickeringii TaxID=345632 RepID=A0A0B5BJ88_9BACT|nr:B12-binding domain-containing radical SAM protein [Geobacter pickeringii]AJE04555.1 radical SAM protein [Geobacter pickeringii]
MKVVLAAIHAAPSPQAVPLANAFLKAYLGTDDELAAAVAVELCDFFAGDAAEKVARDIASHLPDVVGFSIYLWNRDAALRAASLLREARPDLVLFAGGPEATADPERLLGGSPFDFLILGEGEIPFLETMAQLYGGAMPRGVAGTAFRTDDAVVLTPPRQIPLLDTIPSPFLAGALDVRRYSGLLWQFSRGCDFGCEYCFDYKGERGVRRFSMERIDRELDFIVQSGIPQVFVLDSTFNVDRKTAKTVLRMIRARAPHIHFHFEVRSEFIDREMARLFASITCSLQIGLQSADSAVLRKVRRSFDPQDFAERVALLNESGAIFGFDLIYGLPGDSFEGFKRSLDFALSLYPNHLDIFPLAVLPGTPLAQRAETAGLLHQATPPYTLLESPTFPPSAMAEAARLATATDIFYSRGKAVAWFNSITGALGLSPTALLGGFGRWLADSPSGRPGEQDVTDREIWSLQRAYLGSLFAKRGKKKLLSLALDLVDFHYHFAAALLAPPPEIPSDRALSRDDLLSRPCLVSPAARLVRFSYEILDLLEAGEFDLGEFAACFSPAGSWAAIYPRGGEVFTESLLEPHFQFLSSLDGVTSPLECARRLRIPESEAASFLEFALAEGIVVFIP